MSSNNTVNIHVSPGLKLAWELTRHPDSSSTVPSPSEVEQSPSDTDVSAADQPPVSVPHEQALSQAFVANTSEGLSGKWSDNFAITYDDAQTLIKLKRDLWTFGRSQTADLADGGSRFKSQREWETFQEHNATDRQALKYASANLAKQINEFDHLDDRIGSNVLSLFSNLGFRLEKDTDTKTLGEELRKVMRVYTRPYGYHYAPTLDEWAVPGLAKDIAELTIGRIQATRTERTGEDDKTVTPGSESTPTTVSRTDFEKQLRRVIRSSTKSIAEHEIRVCDALTFSDEMSSAAEKIKAAT
jgi:hypothetical protein